MGQPPARSSSPANASICRLRNASMAPCLTMVAIQVIGEAIDGS